MLKGRESTPHIGIYGRRNLGKSSLINMLAGQDIAIIADHAGTTTDPVKKSFEITGFGPVIIIDTAGIDDDGALGSKRVERTVRSIDIIDLAILLVTDNTWGKFEDDMIHRFDRNETGYIILYIKSDISTPTKAFRTKIFDKTGQELFLFSNMNKDGYENLINLITSSLPDNIMQFPSLLGDIVSSDDIVLLITPIDTEAPEGRMILPQVLLCLC